MKPGETAATLTLEHGIAERQLVRVAICRPNNRIAGSSALRIENVTNAPSESAVLDAAAALKSNEPIYLSKIVVAGIVKFFVVSFTDDPKRQYIFPAVVTSVQPGGRWTEWMRPLYATEEDNAALKLSYDLQLNQLALEDGSPNIRYQIPALNETATGNALTNTLAELAAGERCGGQ
jgi:hypothetical protein